MDNNGSAKKFSIISAVCFIVVAVYNIISNIQRASVLEYYSITFMTIIPWVIWVAFAVLMLLQKKNIGLAIVGGAKALLEAYYIINYPSLFNILDFLGSAAMLAIIVFNCMPAIQKKGKAISKLWFIPGAVLAVNYLIAWVQWKYLAYLSQTWKFIGLNIIEIIAYIMFGFWLYRSAEINGTAQTATINEYATFNPQNINASASASSAIGGADKLKMYKELLESGTITQEKFDAKKKQILGLQGGEHMENENIVVKGTMQKNKIALIILIIGIALAVTSFLVAGYTFYNVDGYKSFGFGYGGWYTYCIIYDSFIDFYTCKFFTCAYGYMLLVGIIAAIVGFVIKKTTENCEITVSNSRIFGKVKGGKTAVEIPLNQITALHTCSFNGISIAAISGVSNFHLIENREDVMKAISYLLTNPQEKAAASSGNVATDCIGTSAEKLKQLKELFDSGIISQEEFEAKKKQILEL